MFRNYLIKTTALLGCLALPLTVAALPGLTSSDAKPQAACCANCDCDDLGCPCVDGGPCVCEDGCCQVACCCD